MIEVYAQQKIGDVLADRSSNLNFFRNKIVKRQWPAPRQPNIPEGVPEKIQAIYLEAENNFLARSHLSAAMMFRKTLELSVIELGETKGNLYSKINNLEQQRRISPDLAKWAHEVRLIGNGAAHDDPPEPDEAEADANDIREFTELFLTYIFTLPQRIKERQQLKESASGEESTYEE
jgi:hypothetical protein